MTTLVTADRGPEATEPRSWPDGAETTVAQPLPVLATLAEPAGPAGLTGPKSLLEGRERYDSGGAGGAGPECVGYHCGTRRRGEGELARRRRARVELTGKAELKSRASLTVGVDGDLQGYAHQRPTGPDGYFDVADRAAGSASGADDELVGGLTRNVGR